MKSLPFEKPGKRKKLKPISSLKKKVWRVFSEWVRKRDSDENGYITCCTCSARIHWKEANSSHFLHGHSKATFLDPRNVNASCIRCNLYLHGNLVEYAAFMKARYGWETIDALRELSKETWKPSRQDLEELIQKYA